MLTTIKGNFALPSFPLLLFTEGIDNIKGRLSQNMVMPSVNRRRGRKEEENDPSLLFSMTFYNFLGN
jgi:hypothetical protein